MAVMGNIYSIYQKMKTIMAQARYAMGFLVSLDGQSVLLLEKSRPAFLAGKWMGLAGHIEPGESPLQAVAREVAEEGDVHGVAWTYLKALENPEVSGAEIHVFVGQADLSAARALTDERIQLFRWDELDTIPLGNATIEVLDQIKSFAATARPRTRLAP